MSIPGAVVELNQEIERLTKIRDSLLHGLAGQSQSVANQPVAPQKRKYVRSAKTPIWVSVAAKKSAPAKKSVPVKATPSPLKKEISAATRKKMSDAAKARAATKAEATK